MSDLRAVPECFGSVGLSEISVLDGGESVTLALTDEATIEIIGVDGTRRETLTPYGVIRVEGDALRLGDRYFGLTSTTDVDNLDTFIRDAEMTARVRMATLEHEVQARPRVVLAVAPRRAAPSPLPLSDRYSGSAVASVVLGVVSVLTPVIGILTGGVAIGLGLHALSMVWPRARPRGRWMAVTGIVLGSFAVVLWLWLLSSLASFDFDFEYNERGR